MSKQALKTHLLRNDVDLQRLRAFLKRFPRKANAGDFEEQMQLPNIRIITRLWESAEELTAFAFVDSYNNLRFGIRPGIRSEQIERQIVDWGLACMRQRNAESGDAQTLDASCSAENTDQLRFLEKFEFVQEPIRSLRYARLLDTPVEHFPIPAGYSMRGVTGEGEVEALVDLHRAAFGTNHMTVEERLAIMRSPDYVSDLELVAVAPNGKLSAFCICGFEGGDSQTGYTDPIGVHPLHQRLGLGKSILSAGLHILKDRGASRVELGTSSENLPMQKLPERNGFICVSEKLWFSKIVP